jgi:hypothetical protein
MRLRRPPRLRSLALFALTAVLAACGGGGGDSDHEPDTIDTAGRLALAEADKPVVTLFDLDGARVEASFTVANAPSALYASPGGRYAVVMQRNQDTVQFIDGGIWQEDHGDHLHDYKQAPRAVTWALSGPAPTHYDRQAGRQAVVFMDGRAASTPPQVASARLITDAGIAAGRTEAVLDLPAPIHGLAEPMDDLLLAVHREADAGDALPTHLDLYRRSAATYSFVQRLPTRCDGMHGSFSSGGYTVAGCIDGALIVRPGGAAPLSSKAAAPLRLGTIAGHPRLAGHFVGIGTAGVAPDQTTRFFAIDAAASSASELTLPGWTDGRLRRAHVMDRSGQLFVVLDDQGNLTSVRRTATGWAAAARVERVVPTMPSAAPYPVLVASGARDEIYLSDPVAQQVIVLDSNTLQVKQRLAVGLKPATMTWLGITR